MIISKLIINKKSLYIKKILKIICCLEKTKSSKKQLNFLLRLLNVYKFNKSFSTNSIKNKNIINHNIIRYIINVILSPTNTIINVTDISGKVIISISAGLINLTKFQKKTQPYAIISIFKVLFHKARFLRNKPVAVHFRNVKRFHESFFISALKNKIFIKSFQSYNLTPHNGCRPKKIKRTKLRTKRLVLK